MKNRSTLWVTGGALLTAVLSSACCWLPLLLLAFGASAAGVGGVFETYRPYFLVATAGLLMGAFYVVYFRQRSCDDDSECATPNPTFNRITKVLLWITTAFVFAFAMFPNYIGGFLGDTEAQPVIIDREGLSEFTVEIEGMTCEACAVHTQAALNRLPGIKSATVNYAAKNAIILADSQVSEGRIVKTIEEAGYRTRRIEVSGDSLQSKYESDSP